MKLTPPLLLSPSSSRLAIQQGYKSTVATLLYFQADAEARNQNGETILEA